MKPQSVELERVAGAVVRALREQGVAKLTGGEDAIRRRIVGLIAESFEKEEALEREAERLAASHGAAIANMDRRKIVLGIKARLAKERDFPL